MISSSSKPNPTGSNESRPAGGDAVAAKHAAANYPQALERLPTAELASGSYRLRFARTAEDLDAVLKLRFQVFNLELNEGLASSYATGRDEDEFDRGCHHLVVEHAPTGEVVGTYRIQTLEMSGGVAGLYTAGEYDLSRFPEEILAESVELGRACIDRDHRKKPVLFLLWRGLALYVAWNRKRYLFGCCSITSQDPNDGWRAFAQLDGAGHLRRDVVVGTMPGYECDRNDLATESAPIELPPLFDIYLRFGGKICGPPVIDRAFGTIDFFMLFDVMAMEERSRKMFFDGLPAGVP